ncbi:MAG: hypothetical protein Q8K72_16055 [Acidimicrobiales bacterium]|nr:hypothetical protein [Acidimicrobiales bacterium]
MAEPEDPQQPGGAPRRRPERQVTPGAREILPGPQDGPERSRVHELRLGQIHDDVAVFVGDHAGERVSNDVECGAVGFTPKGDNRGGTVGENRRGQAYCDSSVRHLRCD